MLKVYVHSKNELPRFRLSKVTALQADTQRDRQTDRQTDATENTTAPLRGW